MKLLTLAVAVASLKGPIIVDPPIKNHDDLMVRIEQKFIGFRSPEYGWQEPPKLAIVDWVTPEYRPTIIDYLKAKAKDPQYLERAQRALIALDDEETVVDAIKQFSDGTTQNPSVLAQNFTTNRIKDFILVVYDGSENPIKLDIGNVKSSRYQAIDLILGRIVSSQLFPDATGRWASGFRGHNYNNGSNPHSVWLFQQWWEHNKNAVIAGKYSEATWLPMFKGKPDDFGDDDRSEPSYLNYTTDTRNDILPIPKHASIVSEAKAVPPAIVPKQKNDSLFMFVGLGILAVFASAWVWFKRIKV